MTIIKTKNKFAVVNYPVGDMVARIKNAVRAGIKVTEAPSNKLSFGAANVLKKAGFLSDVKKEGNSIKLYIAYKKKLPVLVDIKVVSKPGKRVYLGADALGKKRGSSMYVITTSKGVMSSKDAIKGNFGGEVIIEAY